MSDNHESVAAKLRKISEWAENNLRDYGADWREHNKLCDMLKKALAAEDADASVGNAAAMREALVRLQPLAHVVWNGGGAEDVSAEIAEMVDIIEAALAAPARNCDATTEPYFDIAKRFKVENCDQFDNDWEDPRTQCTHNCVECVIKWMLATKGGNDGK